MIARTEEILISGHAVTRKTTIVLVVMAAMNTFSVRCARNIHGQFGESAAEMKEMSGKQMIV